MDELKPCPFCGGKVVVEPFPILTYPWQVICRNHELSETQSHTCFIEADTKEEAIAAWNMRSERTCELEHVDRVSLCFELSCGHVAHEVMPNYCPECGARVVGD